MNEETVRALCYAGNNASLRLDFDAAPWFRDQPDDAIEALFRIGCAGDTEADRVAEYVASRGDPEVKAFLKKYWPTHWSGAKTTALYNVRVNPLDASRWVRTNRPALALRLERQGLLR